MGKYTFSWEHAANDVLVTGTFDDWQKTVTLEKKDGVFTKSVELPKVHTQYKFVVDGNWVINESARKEDDGNGIVNNVLLPEDIVDEPVSTLSSAAPGSSTAVLAGAVPKESEKTKSKETLPGAFPETPAAETPLNEAQSFNVAPIPATEGLGNPIKLAPGEPVPESSTLTKNTVDSTVSYGKENEKPEVQSFGVAPFPATAGAGNPIHLAPGEKVPDPSSFTSNTVQSTAKTDPTSYAKSDGLLPDLGLTPQAEREAKGGMFGIPPVMGNMVPESSLPMGVDAKTEKDTGVTIQSAAPTSTTAELAGQVPKEPRGVPEIVSESRKEAGFAPEATSNPIAVLEKKEVEQELKEEVPEAPVAADNSIASQAKANAGAAAATVAAGAAAGAGLFTAAAYTAKDKAAEATGLNGSASPDVPSAVSESQKEAHASPEASANAEAVAEKKAVESELLQEIPKTNEAGEPAPVITAATSTTAPGAKTSEPAPNVPDVVAESQQAAHANPEASANVEAVGEKKAVEAELLEEVKKVNATGEPAPAVASENPAALSDEALVDSKPLKSSSEANVLNAPASAPAQTATTKAAEPTPFTPVEKTSSKPIDSNTNVSFEPKAPATADQSKPAVTTGTETTTIDAKSEPSAAPEASSSLAPETPKKDLRKDSDVSPKGTPGAQSLASAADDKKKKRRSIFGKIKDKLSSKN